jgi:hypothetical protein
MSPPKARLTFLAGIPRSLASATLFLKPSEKVTFIQPATMALSPVLLQGAISFLEALWGHARRAHLIEDALTV